MAAGEWRFIKLKDRWQGTGAFAIIINENKVQEEKQICQVWTLEKDF